MTPEDKTRLAVLEVEFVHLREDLAETRKQMFVLSDRLALLHDLLNQGRGARWAIVALMTLFGSGGLLWLSNFLHTLFKGAP